MITDKKPILWCSNGDTCPYGTITEDDDGNTRRHPEQAYSQQGNYHGLCLNCYDDEMRHPDYEYL